MGMTAMMGVKMPRVINNTGTKGNLCTSVARDSTFDDHYRQAFNKIITMNIFDEDGAALDSSAYDVT